MTRPEFAELILMRMLSNGVPDRVALLVWHDLWHAEFVGNAKRTILIRAQLVSLAKPHGFDTFDYATFDKLYKQGD